MSERILWPHRAHLHGGAIRLDIATAHREMSGQHVEICNALLFIPLRLSQDNTCIAVSITGIQLQGDTILTSRGMFNRQVITK